MIRKKRLLLIIIPIVVVFVMVVVIAIMFMATDIFKSDRELFWNYFAQNVDVSDFLVDKKLEEQFEFKQNNSYISSGDLSMVIEQGENSLKQLNAITNARHDNNVGRKYAEAILKNGDIDLFKVSYINSGDIYGIKCDEIFPNYVGVQNSDLNQLAINYGIPNSNVPNKIVPQVLFNIFDLTDEQKIHLQEFYFPIINNKIQDAQFTRTSEDIAIFGVNKNCNVYSLVLTSNNIKEIIRDLLANAKLDNETMTILTEKFASLEMSVEYTDASNLQLKIDQMIEEVENMPIENNLEIRVYESEGKAIRTTFAMNGNFDIIYDKLDNDKTITIEIPSMDSLNDIMHTTMVNTSTNEIIDLSQETGQLTEKGNTRFIINKKDLGNVATISVQIIPDVNNEMQNINIILNIQGVQNGIFNNSVEIVVNTLLDERNEVIRVTYDTSTSMTDQIEEIEELNGNNTAIANYYQPDEYKAFFKSWNSLFRERFVEKLATLGFNEDN